jgi:phosphopantetheinyl transferase (holo-ACP synthase)
MEFLYPLNPETDIIELKRVMISRERLSERGITKIFTQDEITLTTCIRRLKTQPNLFYIRE